MAYLLVFTFNCFFRCWFLWKKFGRQIISNHNLCLCSYICIFIYLHFSDVALHSKIYNYKIISWISSGNLQINWSIYIDTLTSVMLVVVTSVSALVHIYSIGYMSHDPDKPRFMSYLSLFTFMMLMLVTADNFCNYFWMGRSWFGILPFDWILVQKNLQMLLQ